MIALVRIAAPAAAIAFASASASAAPVAPPIGPGEVYMETANDCGMVVSPADLTPGTDIQSAKENFAKTAWYGRCVDGLIDGNGFFAKPGDLIGTYSSEYILGRAVGESRKHDTEEALTRYWAGGKYVQIYDGPKPFGPRWGWDGHPVRSPDTGVLHQIEAENERCMAEKKTAKSGCSYSNNYRVYTISLYLNGKGKTLFCPDPRTPEGCDKVWMAAGKPIFDNIKAFAAPIEAELASRRTRYQALISPAWRAQSQARQEAIPEKGTAEQLRDRIASLLVSEELDEAVRLNEILVKRFPASTAIAQVKGHFTAAYCLRATPRPQLTVQDWATAKSLYETEPCRRMPFAHSQLIMPNTMLQIARSQADYQSDSDRRSAAFVEQQRQESAAYWGSVLGVITGVMANQGTGPAVAPTYSGTGPSNASPGYTSPSQGADPTSGYSGSASAGAASSAQTGRYEMFRVDPATGCQQYELVNEGGGRRHYQIRNVCNYAITIWTKAELDGRWNNSYDLSREIAPSATAQSHSILASQLQVTVMAVCPAKATLESRLGKRVTGVYTKNQNGDVGCWSVLENTGVGRAN